MWCTRWFLPLLLLPLPTASPYFLLLFLLSLTINAKPCFYCIVLLSTIFVSSCYWQPLPLDSPLSQPWADNITTFAEALNSTLTQTPNKPIPDVIKTMDRCWCDLSYNIMFEPFNVTRWEYLSVLRLKADLERDPTKVGADAGNGTVSDSLNPERNGTTVTAPRLPSFKEALQISRKSIRRFLQELVPPRSKESAKSSLTSPLPSPSPSAQPEELLSADLPLIREKYDLRPYGLGIVVDFGWKH